MNISIDGYPMYNGSTAWVIAKDKETGVRTPKLIMLPHAGKVYFSYFNCETECEILNKIHSQKQKIQCT